MKSSLRKLRGFALNKSSDVKEKRVHLVPARQNELLQASQDVQDMRSCYDSLLSSAAATANSAYEFSEALRDMGTCLLEKTSLNGDEENGKVLMMLGKVQFELQKLVDSYRVHIIQTITTPSESLLKELHIVEEMKRQCDDKRDLYKFMLASHQEKGRTRHAKGESFSAHQLQAAREDYEEEANLFFFRLKSLKQGQSRSLLTQAARHHAAQLNFFRKGVKSLEVVEPHVKVVAERQHIDYDLVGLGDDDSEDDDDNGYYDGSNDVELSFDFGQNEHIEDIESTNKTSVQDLLEKNHGELPFFGRVHEAGSQSAPLLPESKNNPSERIKQISTSPGKLNTYVLPTPVDVKSSSFLSSRNSTSKIGRVDNERWTKQLWHSSPLEPSYKPAKDLKDGVSSLPMPISQSVLKESNTNSSPIKFPPPLAEGLSWPQSNSGSGVSSGQSIKRHAFSGPLIDKSWSKNSKLEYFPPAPSFTQERVQSSTQLSLSPNVSPSSSPVPILLPKNTELHELPRPPIASSNPARPYNLIAHSGPLLPKSQGLYATSHMLSNTASPLPKPPPVMVRSFSIPSNGQRSGRLTDTNFFNTISNPDAPEVLFSPPLMRISLSNFQPSMAYSSEPVAQGRV